MKQYDLLDLIQHDEFKQGESHGLNEAEQEYIIDQALAILAKRHAPGELLKNPADTAKYLQLRLREYKNEVFGVLFLDNQHCVLSFEILFYGTIDGASVYTRVIVQRSLELNAAALIATHNHPSGVLNPSQADKQITKKIQDALALVDIRLLDHLIVTHQDTFSFAEHGIL